MKSRGFRRRFVFLSSILLLAMLLQASSLPASAAPASPANTFELDPLAGEVAAFAEAAAPAGKTSLELARRIGWSEGTARHETDPAKREALLARLAEFRQELEGVARRLAPKAAGGGDQANGAFSGRVTDDGEPVAEVRIEVYDTNGYYRTSAYTGPEGRYSLSLEPGTYFLYADPPYDRPLSPQIFDGLSCFLSSPSCRVTDGTPLTVVSGGHRAADFALGDLGAIEGQVRRRGDATSVETEIRVYDSGLNLIENVWAYQGLYRLGGLPAGDYWVIALGRDDLAGMIYDGVACDTTSYSYPMPCGPAGATQVRVRLDQVVEAIDFDLFRGATLRASVFDARTGAPLENGGTFYVFDAAGNQLRRPYVESGRREVVVEGLAGGIYFASVEAYRYTFQFFDRQDCSSPDGCRAEATPIALALGEETDPLFFPLNRRGSVSGRVTDDHTGAAIENVHISLIEPRSGDSIDSTRSDSAGFFSFSEVPAVPVQLLASDDRYRSEYFDDVDARRGRAAASSLSIRPGEITTVEIGLQPHGSLAVRALAAESGDPVGCFGITAYPLDLSQESFSTSDCPADGWITLDSVPSGQYRVAVSSYERASYLFGKGSCNRMPDQFRCNLEEGATIEVRSGETTDLGQARLERSAAFYAEIRFTAPAGYPHPISARIHLYDSRGVLVRTGNTFPYPTFYFGDLVPGDYYLVADGSPNWQTAAYPDVLCSRWYCDPLRGSRIHLEPGDVGETASILLGPSAPYNRCSPTETSLCLNQGRYRVSATWHDFAGASGAGTARGLTADSGYFYFFSPNNLEVLVKVLNGCAPHLGHHFWVYGAGLTNVQVQLRVEDTLTGAVELYSNALGSTFQPILDNAAFATCDAVAPQSGLAGNLTAAGAASISAAAPDLSNAAVAGVEACSDSGDFCLGGRFAVEATYRTASGTTGEGGGNRVTPDTGTFYFFDVTNVELVVKILDACNSALPGYWVFASGLTDVEVELQITDKATGRSQIYHQPPGPFVPIIDLQSFPCQ